MPKARHSSVQWRIVLIYFMLVFIAMTIVSVFLLDRIEVYQLASLRDNIKNTVSESNLLDSLGNYGSLKDNASRIQQVLDSGWTGSFGSELSVVDSDLTVCASTNTNLSGRNASELFDSDLIVSTLVTGEDGESDRQSGDIAVKNFCYRVASKESGTATGVVYVRADLSSINSFLSQSRRIFIQATLLALIVTIGLGFILARSITVPINSVTESVEKMSRGDFSVSVDVRSDDEIGQLAEMFNLLREKLDATLSEISNEKNKLGTILEYMGDGLIAIDPDGSVIHVNPAARAMLRIDMSVPAEELSYTEVLGHLEKNLAIETVQENIEGGETTFTIGETIYATRYDRFKDENGNDIGIVFIMQDITERQKLEDMQTDFVANVSHELKTPLTNIKSYAETLLDGMVDDPETQARFLGIIDSEADRMNRLVKDLLQLSRLDHSQENMLFKETNIVNIVDMAIFKEDIALKQKDQQLTKLYPENADIRVMVDRDKFEQVVLNVLSNAIKYTDEGGKIMVNVYENHGTAQITVKDNGIGIPEAALPRIFERFYRVDKARSRAMGGTGLGLAITKQIVEEHNGTIEAESREGEGTTMRITLPLANRKGQRGIE